MEIKFKEFFYKYFKWIPNFTLIEFVAFSYIEFLKSMKIYEINFNKKNLLCFKYVCCSLLNTLILILSVRILSEKVIREKMQNYNYRLE